MKSRFLSRVGLMASLLAVGMMMGIGLVRADNVTGDPKTPSLGLDGQLSETTVVVSPDTPNGWGFVDESSSGSASGQFVLGPGTPPLSIGSAELTVDDSGGILVGASIQLGTYFTQVMTLTYSTYRVRGSAALAPALSFNVDYDLTDGDTGWQGRLTYEPYMTGTNPQTGVWESWDALDAGARWWASGAPGNSQCPQASPCSWSDVLTHFPNAGIHATLGAVLFKAGSGWTGGFTGNVDNFALGVDDHNTTYDFEAAQRVQNLDTGTWFPTIQSAINYSTTLDGHTIHATAGVYTETVVVDKQLTLEGDGSGDDPAVDTIVQATTGHGIDLQAGGASASERLILRDLHIRGTSTTVSGTDGIYVNVPLSYVTLDNVAATAHYYGVRVFTDGGVNDLIVDNCRLDSNNHIGFYSQADSGRSDNHNDLVNVQVTNTTFNDNAYKGIYLEKINQATFEGIEVVHSGTLCPQTYYNWPAGVDINLKFGTYQDIVFHDAQIVNSGNADVDDSLCGGEASLDLRAVGITIKARDDGSTYGANPATLDSVELDGVEISGNRTGLRFGEPGQSNAGPSNVTVHHTRIVDNALYGIDNQTVTSTTAVNNWWGCNYGPGSTGAGCVGTTNAITGTASYAPWLMLGLTVTPSTVEISGTATLVADLTWNSTPTDTASLGHLIDGTQATFAASLGTVTPEVTGTVAGQATSVFASGAITGTAILSTTVDSQTVAQSVGIVEPSYVLYLPVIMKDSVN